MGGGGGGRCLVKPLKGCLYMYLCKACSQRALERSSFQFTSVIEYLPKGRRSITANKVRSREGLGLGACGAEMWYFP